MVEPLKPTIGRSETTNPRELNFKYPRKSSVSLEATLLTMDAIVADDFAFNLIISSPYACWSWLMEDDLFIPWLYNITRKLVIR